MAFTHALYYPWIDIENSDWLKTAVLYWDKISSIVPYNMTEPYTSVEGAFLRDANILVPEFVDPSHPAVIEASRDFLDYLSTPEAMVIMPTKLARTHRLPSRDQATAAGLAKLNKSKIGKDLTQALHESGKVFEDEEWIRFDRGSINYYMTLLAASLSRYTHFAPLADNGNYETMANMVIRGDNPRTNPQNLGQALLAKITLETVKIAPDTPLETIIGFRNDYKDEIGRFRSEIGRLAQDIDPETPSIEAFQQQIDDIYINDISPAIHTLQRALEGKKIVTWSTHLLAIIFAGSIPFIMPNTPVNFALSAGCEIIGNTINYLVDRKKELGSNPYSFVLSAQAKLS